MGTATPKTGQISFADLNTGILQASSTAQVDMNTAAQRIGFGATSQLSMSELRGCYGVATTWNVQPATKYAPSYYYSPEYTHSPAYDAFYMVQDAYGGSDSISFLYLSGTGWDGTNLNRFAVAATLKTYTSGSAYGGTTTPNWINGGNGTAVGLRFG